MSDTLASIIAIPTGILGALFLVGIGLLITSKPRPRLVRKHTGADTYWQLADEELDRPEGVLTCEHKPRHAVSIDDDNTDVMGVDLEAWESTGRRGADSVVRHIEVAPDWMPPLGNVRIAILGTPTAEYLFVRKPHDQLQPRLVRSYVAA